jgi:apolipoprotein D and lipocalin family protein
MGRWHVIANIPTPFEVGATHCIENYTWDETRKCIQVNFTYRAPRATAESVLQMRAYIKNAPVNSQWSLSPQLLGVYVPLGLTYLIAHLADGGSYVIVSVPDRSYLWIMARARPAPSRGRNYYGCC